jgi:hypothetical protein
MRVLRRIRGRGSSGGTSRSPYLGAADKNAYPIVRVE